MLKTHVYFLVCVCFILERYTHVYISGKEVKAEQEAENTERCDQKGRVSEWIQARMRKRARGRNLALKKEGTLLRTEREVRVCISYCA